MRYSCFSLELLDKLEPPQIQEGYGLSVAVLTLLNIVRCVHKIIDGSVKDDDVIVHDNDANDVDKGDCRFLSHFF